jgi:predicted HTH domain antitoxin
VTVTIADDVLQAAHMSAEELRRELAVLLFQQDRLTLAQAARLAEVDRLRFQHLLASRGIPIHYDVEDFEQDLETLRSLDRPSAISDSRGG